MMVMFIPGKSTYGLGKCTTSSPAHPKPPNLIAANVDGRARRRKPPTGEARRQFIVLCSVAGSAAELMQGLWRGGSTKRFLIPPALILCAAAYLAMLVKWVREAARTGRASNLLAR